MPQGPKYLAVAKLPSNRSRHAVRPGGKLTMRRQWELIQMMYNPLRHAPTIHKCGCAEARAETRRQVGARGTITAVICSVVYGRREVG